MTSTGADSRYLHCLADWLLQIASRPGMYFADLRELETLLLGHEHAFHQLGMVDGGFHRRFCSWLREEQGVRSTSAGWAVALLAAEDNDQKAATRLFFDRAARFLTATCGLHDPRLAQLSVADGGGPTR